MTQNMWNVFILLGGIFLFVTIIGVMDVIGRRQQRRKVGRS
jgi:hypothetical protein